VCSHGLEKEKVGTERQWNRKSQIEKDLQQNRGFSFSPGPAGKRKGILAIE